MRLAITCLVIALGGCQYIIDIPDRELGTPDDAGPGGDGGIDAGIVGECNPLDQTGCDAGERCTTARSDDTSTTVCTSEGTVGNGGSCTVDSQGIDDCITGLVCDPTGSCQPICSVERGACSETPGPRTCQTFSSVFDDQSGLVGVCQHRCDVSLQDCDIDKACYLNVELGEAQCFTPFDFGGGTGTYLDPCGRDGSGCAVNGCDQFLGPHYSAVPGDPPGQCAFYCRPLDTSTETPFNANGDMANNGECPGIGAGGGSGMLGQCRFLQVVLGDPNIRADYGMCVEPEGAWKDCTSCDISQDRATSDATCGAGCVSQATLDSLP